MDLGYKAMLHHLYGDNIMFEEAAEANRLHALMHHVFIQNALLNFDSIVQKFIQRHFSDLHSRPSVQVYETFKLFATELMLALFLDLDVSDSADLVHDVASLATTHWHGVISVPMNWSVSYWSSSCKRAVEAKDKLLERIRDRLASQTDEGSFLTRAREAGFKDHAELEQHILPFVSALVPKAIASLLASFTLALCSENQEDMQEKARESSDYLDWCLLETERLWPPVLGGRRLVREDFVLDGYKVPKGYAVIYVSSIAHRDPNVFKNPNSFDPTRWANKRTEKEKLLFCYGDGPRCCVGTSLMKNLIKKVSQYLVGHYNWTLGDQEEDLDYKWLPMARPRELSVSFTRIDQSEASSELAGSD
ncbi:putative cytochrome P450 120 isoform X2 [Strongylocentrotus purpuratus]|nr:putative cytochrome P450 120 isoform X2 [Strongylocentrotus purpuratus]XP_030841573.1 putative cytochrome P450 120 isoform X2 [Strongylocentrotus purpuratus]